MENTFHILGQDIAFSQERINYVALKGAYYSLGLNAEKNARIISRFGNQL